MLCSVQEPKSGSNWLDRLRSNKGFPTGSNLDIDNFLSQNPNQLSPSNSPHSNSKFTPPNSKRALNRSKLSRRAGEPQKEWVGVMSSVLSELFFMGGSDEISRVSGKKIPRKQSNPRICVRSTGYNTSNSNASINEEKKSSNSARKVENVPVATASFSSDGNSLTDIMEERNAACGIVNVDCDGDFDEMDEAETLGKAERELKGYSRSEVTVIDTSCGPWKSEKLVFRRKNVWKVREKKGKSRSFGRKKRKVRDGGDPVFGGNKKVKLSTTIEEENGGQCSRELISNREQSLKNLKNDSRDEVCKAAVDNLNVAREVTKYAPHNLSQGWKKRFTFSRSPRKMRQGDSSVVLIKGIPTDKKIGWKLCKNIGKGLQRLKELD